jgi:thiamine pyrophosphokinase
VRFSQKALICLDGQPPSKATFDKVLPTVGCVIAADGGANWLYEYQIAPNVLIGDLDGIRKDVLLKLPSTSIIEKEDQYSTDLEKAFTWAIRQRFKHVTVMAIAGKRTDHMLSNFSLLWKFHKKLEIEIQDDHWTGHILPNEKQEFDVQKGMTISLIPYSNCSGITLKGFQYPLTQATMKQGEVGISNVATSKSVTIEVKKGRMLAIFLKEKQLGLKSKK